MSTIDWDFTNPEHNVETTTVGPDEMRFVIDLWHNGGFADLTCTVVVWRGEPCVDYNLVFERDFDNVAQAKEWVRARFGDREAA